MNSSIQDSFNLGWKIALASKSLASSSLLSSYTSERLPVIAKVLGKTTELLKETVSPENTNNLKKAWTRGPELYQLDVNYRCSPTVFDELDTIQMDDSTRVTAGDRAPDAPGLVSLTQGLQATQLFHLFEATSHIALIFPRDDSDTRTLPDLFLHSQNIPKAPSKP